MSGPKPYYADEWATIYHGDCRELSDAHPVGAAPSMIITDPPYGIDHRSGYGASWQGNAIAGDENTHVRDEFLAIACTPTFPQAIFGTWKTAAPDGVKAVLVWDKGPASGMGDLAFPWKNSFELIYILGARGLWKHNHRDEGVIKGRIQVSWESKGRKHPNQKPVSLLTYLIARGPASGAVLDPFMGSGTTLVAAKAAGRKSIGIEIEEKYCEVAANRLSQGVLW